MLKNMNKTKRSNLITYAIVIVAFVVMQILSSTGSVSSLLTGLLVPLCTYIILAVSLNLVVGILGELSLGHAGFMCVGAFSSAFFSKCMRDVIENSIVRFLLALLIGVVVAAIFGVIIGIPVLRLKGDYLAIVTLAFGEIIKNLVNVLYIGKDSKGFHFATKDVMALNMDPDGTVILNGPQGITGTPKDSTFLIGFILIMVTLFIVLNLINSRDGRAIMAIRDNVIAAESIGINVTKYKLMAFTISAAMAGAAGVLYAHNLSTLTANTNNFGYNMSITILVFVVLGGIGNIRGSIIAAVILTLLPELLRGLSDYRMLIYAIVLIIMMLFNWAPKAIEWREKYLHFGKKNIEISKAGIARTFQNIRLFKELTVLDNVKVGLHNHHHYSTIEGILRLPNYRKVEKEMNEKAMELLKVFDLEKFASYKAANLPYGQQRKLEIARALATDPKLLLLDEPAAGMNPNETGELMDMIRFVRDEFHMTILLIEHDMKLVSGICEELTVLNFGEVLAQGKTTDVLNDPQVIKAYLGE